MGSLSKLPIFPPKRRQRSKSRPDRLFIAIPLEGGGYKRLYLGEWDDPNAHAEYDRLRTFHAVASGITASPPTPADPTLTIYQLADQYLEWARIYYRKDGRPTKEPTNLFLAFRPLLDLYGNLRASEFGQRQLGEIQTILDCSGRLSRPIVNRRIQQIRRLFRWGAQRELIPVHVVTSLSLLPPLKIGRCHSPDRPAVKSVPLDVVEATLPHLPTVFADMIRLQLLTGCRPEEIRIMRVCDIRRDSPDTWHYYPAHDKMQHTRKPGDHKIISLGRQAIDIIAARTFGLPDNSDEYVFRPVDSYAEHLRDRRANRKSKITPSQAKRAIAVKEAPRRKFAPFFSGSAYRQAITRACKRAGVPHWYPYQLRHTSATRVERLFGWRAAQVHLGHKSPDTTRIYVDQNQELADQIAREIG